MALMNVGRLLWVREGPNEPWLLGSVESKPSSNQIRVTVQAPGNRSKTITFRLEIDGESEHLKFANDPSDVIPNNLIHLRHLNEPTVTHALRERYRQKKIYTFTGNFLTAVNPFENMDHQYRNNVIDQYYDQGSSAETELLLPPHVFGVASRAYRNMVNTLDYIRENVFHGLPGDEGEVKKPDQVILISGESGAGKTETTKYVLKYLATVGTRQTQPSANPHAEGIMNKVLDSNPILEAFGNAKTLRNANSSRFGKFIELHFDASGNLVGSLIKTYLLEKVRVVQQTSGEGSFHMFHQLCTGASEQEKRRWNIAPESTYQFLQQECSTAHTSNMAEHWNQTKNALYTCEFSEMDIDHLMRCVSGLLWLGNVRFQSRGDDVSEPAEDGISVPSLINAAALFGVDAGELRERLCHAYITVNGERTRTNLDPAYCTKSRNALAMSIYGRAFQWIQHKINQCMACDVSHAIIGVLDIFGFECFEKNSLEQLCINYTNEKLQEHFANYVIRSEQQEYVREGLAWDIVSYEDNSEVVDLFNRKGGIFALLQDQCVATGSDEAFLNHLHKIHNVKPPDGRRSAFVTNDVDRRLQGAKKFGIYHYAGRVDYSVEGFTEKNADKVPPELSSLLDSSCFKPLKYNLTVRERSDVTDEFNLDVGPRVLPPRGMFGKMRQLSTGVAAHQRLSLGKQKGVGDQFKEAINTLMTKINKMVPLYIRCIKPNDDALAGLYNPIRVSQQLRSSGVVAAIDIARSGFGVRFTHREFSDRFKCLARMSGTPSDIEMARHLCSSFLQDGSYALGATKVFLHNSGYEALESRRLQLYSVVTKLLQKVVRGFLARRKIRKMREKMEVIVRIVKNYMKRKRILEYAEQLRLEKKARHFEKLRLEEELNRIAEHSEKLRLEEELNRIAEQEPESAAIVQASSVHPPQEVSPPLAPTDSSTSSSRTIGVPVHEPLQPCPPSTRSFLDLPTILVQTGDALKSRSEIERALVSTVEQLGIFLRLTNAISQQQEETKQSAPENPHELIQARTYMNQTFNSFFEMSLRHQKEERRVLEEVHRNISHLLPHEPAPEPQPDSGHLVAPQAATQAELEPEPEARTAARRRWRLPRTLLRMRGSSG